MNHVKHRYIMVTSMMVLLGFLVNPVHGMDDAELNAEEEVGCTRVYKAAKKGDCVEVARLLASKADIEKGDSDHETTPLHVAASKGNVDVVRLLLENKANVHVRDKYRKDTPLHKAAWGEPCEEIIDLLVAAGADVNAVNKANELAIQLAIEGQRQDSREKKEDKCARRMQVEHALRRHGSVDEVLISPATSGERPVEFAVLIGDVSGVLAGLGVE